MKELETILKVLGAKINDLETTIFIRDMEIKRLKEQLAQMEGDNE